MKNDFTVVPACKVTAMATNTKTCKVQAIDILNYMLAELLKASEPLRLKTFFLKKNALLID